MKKKIDARGASDPMEELRALIINDNCSASEGIEVRVDGESTAKRLSLFTSILGYENRIVREEDHFVLQIEIAACVCPLSA